MTQELERLIHQQRITASISVRYWLRSLSLNRCRFMNINNRCRIRISRHPRCSPFCRDEWTLHKIK